MRRAQCFSLRFGRKEVQMTTFLSEKRFRRYGASSRTRGSSRSQRRSQTQDGLHVRGEQPAGEDGEQHLERVGRCWKGNAQGRTTERLAFIVRGVSCNEFAGTTLGRSESSQTSQETRSTRRPRGRPLMKTIFSSARGRVLLTRWKNSPFSLCFHE